MDNTLLTFNDFVELLLWLTSLAFGAYIISYSASFFARFFSSVVKYFRNPANYDKDYNFPFLRFNKVPDIKGVRKNHGRRLPFFNKR